MPDIKTRDIAKGTIKTIDKSAVAAERMKSAFIQTKEKAEHSVDVPESSAEEYASNRLESGIDRVSHEAVAQAFPKQLLYYNTDVCDEIQINSAVKEIIAAFHFIDIAIHNACLCTFDSECSIDLDIYKQVFNVNYYGGLRFAKSVIPYMQAQKRGKIIFTSSGVGVTGFIGISPYASTKGALESLAKCLNIEYTITKSI